MGTFLWRDGRLAEDSGEAALLVADSWLVSDGVTRALPLHHDRFVSSCEREAGLGAAAVRRFLDSAAGAVPRTGRWFPRVECGADHRLRLRLRPAPEPSAEVVLLPHPGPDPRRHPRTKGPDLVAMQALRVSAASAGADEVLLCTGTGTVLEGALSSVVWWRGDLLCVPDPSLPVLDSVTRRLVVDLAGRQGVAVRPERCDLASLDGLEVWSLGALHGIRAVTGWRGCGLTAGPAVRADEWRALL
ncbi:aminotransferase class IV [Lentzea sp. NPDC042327]|uniref:aminotransferase class IV n=1 Tax=Lentzea sp. NPDC042327 TaxID=3154801 RepID=UPI0033FC47AA